MRAITLALFLLLPLSTPAFDYAGDEALRREAALTVLTLTEHGFPAPDAVTLQDGVLTLSFDGVDARGALPPAGGTLVETLIGTNLAYWGPSVPEPLAGAVRAYLSARTRGSEWTPRSLSDALLQAFVVDVVKDAPERLGGLWEAAGRGDPWTGMERFFNFQFGLAPEAFFARCAARSLPHLLPFLNGIPSASVREGETDFSLPAAAPLSASALDLGFPSGKDLGLALAWDGGRLPAPTFLLVAYGAPLDHFDLIDLESRFDGITLPLSGVSKVVLIATNPAFARPTPDPIFLRGTLAEGFPCRLAGIDLQSEEDEASLSFTADAMADVAAFVVLRGTASHPGRLETVGFLPGLGQAADPYTFTLVDPEHPPAAEAPVYYLFAITADGLMAHQGTLPLPAR